MNSWHSLFHDQHPHAGGLPQPSLAAADHLTVIHAHGEEAGDYLQGQLTCDLRDVDQGAQRVGLHLSLKGRGVISLRIAKVEGGYLLLVPSERVDATLAALNKYKLRAKVEFQPEPDLLVAQLAGAVAMTLEDAGLPVPGPGQAASRDGVSVLRYPHSDHALVVAPASLFAAHWQSLTRERALTDGDGARYQDVLAGEAQIHPGAEDLFLPQVLNYDALDAVSFKKGCYTGQEVVARMHFKGKLKQRLRAFHYSAGNPGLRLAPGQSLRNAKGRPVGEVVDSAPGEPQPVALAVIRLTHEGELYLDDQALEVSPIELPYAVPKPRE